MCFLRYAFLEFVLIVVSCPLQTVHPEWAEKRYVAMLSYRSAAKIMSNMDVVELIEYYTSQHGDGPDVVALLSPHRLSLRQQALRTHGILFVEIWHEVLRRLGFDDHTVRASDSLSAFFCNYWLARPKLMSDYIAFLEHAIMLLEHDPALSYLVRADARYAEGRQEVARAVFDTPFYQLHPFICERLPIVFFWDRHACVLHVHSEFRRLQNFTTVG